MSLVALTREHLGTYAEQALQNGAVVPLNNKKPVTKWGQYINPEKPYAFDGIAVKTGRDSGLTVVDYDAMMPDNANVKTRRGGHVWLPWDNDRTKHYSKDNIDVCGSGALAIFHSQNHHVLHTVLANRSDYTSLLFHNVDVDVLGSICSSIYNPYLKEDVRLCVTLREGYLDKVKTAGYDIDVDRVIDALAKQVASAPAGARNTTLYRNLCQVLALGGETTTVATAAYKAGLTGEEINQTLRSAQNSGRHVDVFEQAMAWSDLARQTLDSAVVAGLAMASVEQHTTKPSFNQSQCAEDYSMNRRTVIRQLQMLEAAGLVKVQRNGKIPGQGSKDWPNNYKLLLPEVAGDK